MRTLRTRSKARSLAPLASLLLAAPAPAIAQEPVTLHHADPPAAPGAFAHRAAPDGEGALLVWLEPLGNNAHRLRTSRFEAGAWSPPATIHEADDFFANWADVPAIVRAPDNSLVAGWLRKSGPGTYAYDVVLARSTDNAATWTILGSPHDDGTQTEHGFFSMIPEGNALRLFWLDGRNMTPQTDDPAHAHAHGSGDMTLRTALLTPRDNTGIRAMLSDERTLDRRVCECCATSAALTPAGPIVAYRDRDEREIRDISLVRAVRQRWSAPASPGRDNWVIPACPVNGPAIGAHTGGVGVAVAWYTGARGGAVRAAFSADAGAIFREPVTVAQRDDSGAPLGRVDLVMLDDDTAIVTWLHQGADAAQIRARRVGALGDTGPTRTLVQSATSRTSGFPNLLRLGDRLLLIWTQVDENHAPAGVRAALFDAP